MMNVTEVVNIEHVETMDDDRQSTRTRSPDSAQATLIVKGEFSQAWFWVEGWRAQLRKSGDVVEKARWEWRLEDLLRKPNSVPGIIAKTPGVSALKGREKTRDRRRKSVHWK